MLNAIIAYLVDVAFLVLAGVGIAYCASISSWGWMAAIICIVPRLSREILSSHTELLRQCLIALNAPPNEE